VYAVSIVVSIALGRRGRFNRDHHAADLIYTFEGGLAAVIWTDVVQTFIYVGGKRWWGGDHSSSRAGGWASIERLRVAAQVFRCFDLHFFDPSTVAHWPHLDFASLIRCGRGLSRRDLHDGSHATDQSSCRDCCSAESTQSALALVSSGLRSFFQFGLFLVVA